jgi:hypothetical protein
MRQGDGFPAFTHNLFFSCSLPSLCALVFLCPLLTPISNISLALSPPPSVPSILRSLFRISARSLPCSRTSSFSSPLSLSYSPNASNYLVRLPHYLSHLRLFRGSFVEGVAQAPEPAHSSYLAFFPLPLVLLTIPFSLVEHHFRLLNIRFQFCFLSHILSQVPHHFSSFFFSSLFTKWSRMYTLPIVPLPFLNAAWLSNTTPFSTLCSSDNHL